MTTLLVDANNLAMRSLHAMARSGLTSSHGVATGPLLAFIGGLAKHIAEEQPDRVAVCWDGGRSEHRVGLDEQYKAHRLAMDPAQEELKYSVFALAKEFCTLAGIHHVERQGFEADDLIAYYVRHRPPEALKTVIVSSDKDFLQLVGEDVEQVRLSSAGTATDRWTQERVLAEHKCYPEGLTLAMALAGDVSDNVIGVKGFGMKTAIKTLDKYGWDFDAVLRDHPRVAPDADRVRLNLDLVNLHKPVPGLVLPALPLFRPTSPGTMLFGDLSSFLTRYEMKSVQDRLNSGSLWR
jgi:DNA polymerase-1